MLRRFKEIVMGQFKPMVKMMTTEPSVILKLKKGGSVANPKKMAMGGSSKPLPQALNKPTSMIPQPKVPRRGSGPNDAGPTAMERFRSMVGKPGAPKKMAMGGLNAVKSAVGKATSGTGMIPPPKVPRRGSGPNDAGPMGPRPMPLPRRGSGPNDAGPMKPLVKPPVSRHPDDFGLKPAMKNGGGFETAKMHAKEKKAISNVEKKLSKHADMPASKGHKGLKTGGVVKGQGGYKTGGVVNGQGGYKNGGAAKKHYATGGIVDSGAPVAMPERKKSAPVAIDRLAGTFKKGGKVRGGSAC